MLNNADTVHITDDLGTNLTLKIKGRRINISDGFISDEDMKRGDNGENLPTGEVFVAPIETEGEGTLFCPITRDRQTLKVIKGVTLVFKNGKLILEKCSAEENEEDLRKTIENHVKIDKRKYETIRTTNIAELGIGLNELIKKAIGYILTDEKIGGSIHVAIGDNKSYGGTSESSLHWDFVTCNRITMEVTYTDGRKRTIIENGKILEQE